MSHLAKPPIEGLETILLGHFDCRYLPQRHASAEVVSNFGNSGFNDAVYSTLYQHGFRSDGHYMSRYHCDGCSACVQVRIVADEFMANRNQRRNWHRNYACAVRIIPPKFSEEHYELYRRYQTARQSGENIGKKDYNELLGVPTRLGLLFEFRELEGGRVLGVSLADLLEPKGGSAHGLVGLYIFYEPKQLKLGLGTFAVLSWIRYCHWHQIPYIYLHEWNAEHPKLAYKTSFQPLEGFIDEQWQRIGKDGLVVPHNTSTCPLKLSENSALPFAQHF